MAHDHAQAIRPIFWLFKTFIYNHDQQINFIHTSIYLPATFCDALKNEPIEYYCLWSRFSLLINEFSKYVLFSSTY